MTTSTLVLYDTTGEWGWLGELYGIMTANLASHFGSWTAMPVVSYQTGQLKQYTAAIYIGSTYGEPIPNAFLNDVFATTIPVIWAYDNIWQLTSLYPNFSSTYGWMWSGFDTASVAEVEYPLPPSTVPTQQLTRYAANGAGIMNYSSIASNVTVLANCVTSSGSTFPWALSSTGPNGGTLTYIGEIPLVYISEGDRYLAFCDLLFDALAPATATRHRALVRLEDIDPTYNTSQIMSAAKWLQSQKVPFGFQIIPLYLDPLNANGEGTNITLQSKAQMISTIKSLESMGGVMVCHGYTHQYDSTANPYTGATGDDCEFYRITMNSNETLNYMGPIPGDSLSWAQGRFSSAQTLYQNAGFPMPQFVTFPSYAASAVDYLAANGFFTAAMERRLYPTGILSGQPYNYSQIAGQYMPYTVQDVYGMKVLADTLGGIEPQPYYSTPAVLPATIIANAQRNLVVRDGWASFFYHTYDSLSYLQQTVTGIQALGYTFVSPTAA
jgi:uncharacterized protein YdaL